MHYQNLINREGFRIVSYKLLSIYALQEVRTIQILTQLTTCVCYMVYVQSRFVDYDLLSVHTVLVSGSEKMTKTFAENKLNCLERERENPALLELMVAT